METLKKDDKKFPSTLYHYTSFDNALNILDGNPAELLATDMRFLLDKTEIIYGVRLLLSKFNNLFEGKNPVLPQSARTNIVPILFEKLEEWASDENCVFVACFSKRNNNKYFWDREPENMVAIGFDTSEIQLAFEKKIYPDDNDYFDSQPRLEQCRYGGKTDLTRLFKNELVTIENYYKGINGNTTPKERLIYSYRSFIEYLIYTCFLFFKSKEYSVEEEYRLAFSCKWNDPGIRMQGGKPRYPVFQIDHPKMVTSLTLKVGNDLEKLSKQKLLLTYICKKHGLDPDKTIEIIYENGQYGSLRNPHD